MLQQHDNLVRSMAGLAHAIEEWDKVAPSDYPLLVRMTDELVPLANLLAETRKSWSSRVVADAVVRAQSGAHRRTDRAKG